MPTELNSNFNLFNSHSNLIKSKFVQPLFTELLLEFHLIYFNLNLTNLCALNPRPPRHFLKLNPDNFHQKSIKYVALLLIFTNKHNYIALPVLPVSARFGL